MCATCTFNWERRLPQSTLTLFAHFFTNPLVSAWSNSVMAKAHLSFQADVIEAILKPCRLCNRAGAGALPEVDDVVLELDVAYSGSAIDSPDEVDQPQETIYVDIDTFLEF